MIGSQKNAATRSGPALLDGLAQGVGRVPRDAHGVSDELPEPRLEGVQPTMLVP